jgi:hypothetical protein
MSRGDQDGRSEYGNNVDQWWKLVSKPKVHMSYIPLEGGIIRYVWYTSRKKVSGRSWLWITLMFLSGFRY